MPAFDEDQPDMQRPPGHHCFGQCQISEMQTGNRNSEAFLYRVAIFAAVFTQSESDRESVEIRKKEMLVLKILSGFQFLRRFNFRLFSRN
jgi:hypothetical protein